MEDVLRVQSIVTYHHWITYSRSDRFNITDYCESLKAFLYLRQCVREQEQEHKRPFYHLYKAELVRRRLHMKYRYAGLMFGPHRYFESGKHCCPGTSRNVIEKEAVVTIA